MAKHTASLSLECYPNTFITKSIIGNWLQYYITNEYFEYTIIGNYMRTWHGERRRIRPHIIISDRYTYDFCETYDLYPIAN